MRSGSSGVLQRDAELGFGLGLDLVEGNAVGELDQRHAVLAVLVDGEHGKIRDDHVDHALNHDVFVSYRSAVRQNPRGVQWLLSGVSMTFGIKDVLDRTPRFWAAATQSGIAPYDSIMGRSVWLQMRKEFQQKQL